MSKWSVEALLLSDDLAKLIEANRIKDQGEREMPIVPVSTGKTKPKIPDGNYTFQITDAAQSVWQSDKFGHAGEPNLTLSCLIMGVLDEDGEDIYLDPQMSLKYKPVGKTPPSTLYLYAKAAGVLAEPGEPFNTDALVGRVLSGNITTEGEDWPKIEPKSLMPSKTAARAIAQKEQGAPSEGAVPWESAETGVDDLATWRTKLIDVGYTPAEIANHSKAAYDRLPADLTPIEREELAKSLGV